MLRLTTTAVTATRSWFENVERANDAAVTAVSLARSAFENQERVAVTAGVVNHSSRSLTGGQLTLEIGGRPIQTERLDVEANGSGHAQHQRG